MGPTAGSPKSTPRPQEPYPGRTWWGPCRATAGQLTPRGCEHWQGRTRADTGLGPHLLRDKGCRGTRGHWGAEPERWGRGWELKMVPDAQSWEEGLRTAAQRGAGEVGGCRWLGGSEPQEVLAVQRWGVEDFPLRAPLRCKAPGGLH